MTSPAPERTRPKAAMHRAAAPWWRRWQWLAALVAAGLAVLGVAAYIASDRTGSTAESSQGAASSVSSIASGGPDAITVHHHALRVTPEESVASLKVPSQLADALKKWDAGPGEVHSPKYRATSATRFRRPASGSSVRCCRGAQVSPPQ